MLTFEEIREFQRKERASPKLVALPPDFWKQVAEYISDKMRKYEELKKNTSRFTDKVLAQFEREIRNAARVIVELYTLREKKMLMLAWAEVATDEATDTRPMTPEEREAFGNLLEVLKGTRRNILDKVLAGEKAEQKGVEEEKHEESVKVKILEKVPAFLGTDLNLYGPYEPGEIVSLPPKYADLLVEKGKAERVEEGNA